MDIAIKVLAVIGAVDVIRRVYELIKFLMQGKYM